MREDIEEIHLVIGEKGELVGVRIHGHEYWLNSIDSIAFNHITTSEVTFVRTTVQDAVSEKK
jgi:hypothetical protein